MAKGSKKSVAMQEPRVIIRPIGKMGGLDNIHAALVVLVLILLALLVYVSYAKPPVIAPLNATNSTSCKNGTTSNGCLSAIHTPAEIKSYVEHMLASYSEVNSSLSILPYISNITAMSISYLPSGKWYAVLPAHDPVTGAGFYLSFLLNDKNLSDSIPFLQAAKPSAVSNNYVASDGVISMANASSCVSASPLQIYWFLDPYSPGAISSLSYMTSMESRFGSRISVYPEILFSQYSQGIADSEGTNSTLELGAYLFCASLQSPSQFSSFASKLNSTYSGSYMSSGLLAALASSAGLNETELGGCLSSAPGHISSQELLAKQLKITSTPAVVTDCRYLSLPETAADAVCYANSSLC